MKDDTRKTEILGLLLARAQIYLNSRTAKYIFI